LLEIIFDVVSPGALGYIKRTGAALKSILKNPLPFMGNLVKAAKLGFQNFASHFGEHLKAGLIDWLTGSLPGIYIPKAFSLGEIVKFVFSVFKLTWENVRAKLVNALDETTVKAMETGFDIVVTLVREGPAAAWDKIKEQLSNLKDMVIGGITDFIIEMVVTKAVPKLIAMFIPGAGFISAILTIYDTVMVFVNKISQIIQVVTGFIDSIVSIAAGAIDTAAKRVESTLAGLLSLAISFLAGFLGLGKVADKIMVVIDKVRTPIDKALDFLVAWIVKMAKTLFKKVFGKKEKAPAAKEPGKKDKPDERTDTQKKADLDKAITESEGLLEKEDIQPDEVEKALPGFASKYRLTELSLKQEGEFVYHVYGVVNPPKHSKKKDLPRYKVGTHTVKAPTGRTGGASHHVPVKVMKMWFGDTLRDASKEADDTDLRKRLRKQSKECLRDTEGKNLSAIWLSKRDHVTVHHAKPSMGIALIKTKTGDVATKPTRATFRGSVPTPFAVVGKTEKNPDTKQLRKTFRNVFNSMLEVGLATLAALKLKGAWKSRLTTKAKTTWKNYKNVPQKK
jgi:hypothetical protein